MNIDATTFIDGEFFAGIYMQVSQNYVRQIVIPYLVGGYFSISKKMSVLSPCFQLYPPFISIVTDLDTIAYDERKIGSRGIYVYLDKYIKAVICFYLNIGCLCC